MNLSTAGLSSPAAHWQSMVLLIICLLASPILRSQPTNVLIHDGSRSCEPSIALDPNDPSRIVAGSIIDNYYYSTDTGRTWQLGKLQSPWGVWGDPVIDVDEQGSFYYFHLSNTPDGSWIDRIVCQRSDDGGATWTDGSYVGLNGSKAQDKHWSLIDRARGVIHLTWTQFDKYDSADPADRSNIMYSQSADRGETWTTAKVISTTSGDCIDDDDTVEGATSAIGPNGQLYVTWAGPEGLVFKKSLDQGATWSDDEMVLDPFGGGWAMDIPGIYRSNGMPVLKCDLSDGPSKGDLYVCWADQSKGENDTEIWLKKSSDEGGTWSEKKSVNRSIAGSHQFLPWMDIDQATGHLYFVYYDQRPGLKQTTVWMALSKDGGETFHRFKISEAPFLPTKEVFFGDYNNITAHDGVVRPIWTRMDQGSVSVWTALVDDDLATQCRSRASSISVDFDLPERKKVKIYYGNVPKRDLRRPKEKRRMSAGQQRWQHDLDGEAQGPFHYQLKAGRKVLAEGVYYLE